MQWLIEIMAGFVAMLAAAALSQFGLDLGRPDQKPEVRRTHDCVPAAVVIAAVSDGSERQDC